MNEFRKLPQPNPVATYPVHYVSYRMYRPNRKRADVGGHPLNAGARPSLEVSYFVTNRAWVSEWVSFEGGELARTRAIRWWQQRSRAPVPATTAEALALADSGALAAPVSITVRQRPGAPFPQIIGYTFAASSDSPAAPQPQTQTAPPSEHDEARRQWYYDDPVYWDTLDDAL